MLAVDPASYPDLQLSAQPVPMPAAGQLLVRVRAAGINRADLAQAAGKYPPPAGESAILGLEIAGEVIAIGPEVKGFAPGARVFGLVAGGGYAECCLLDAALARPLPEWLDWAAAASLPEAWLTAWLNLIEIGRIQPGMRALIHAGASGVGAAAIQLAKARGAWVATTASAGKLDWCRGLGADLALDYARDDFAAEIRAAGGADLILDGVGGDYLVANQRCLNPDGQLILIGLLRGTLAELNLGLMLVKRQRLQGSTLRSLPLEQKARLSADLYADLLPGLEQGRYRLTLDKIFALTEVAEAHRYIAANQNLGKVVLQM
ncbi:NAD(P)H-quinone oxidoreductase [Chitinilyticum piscinae]|uniref:NAD(P)H-quinone oxidoreductase n=1 Tax=Chitinilyticum piscinae TaxID=2866724 RepID=A0A8J7FLT7_9NEIS|nr:NAD(P)H-quinone oxidoreductase [Chitinilyticum piscinae]MBE9610140.1 NAD(P)H-quinone oxidoreductase [Chitinilyticum piscinae]